jgi:hypothetical protein
MHTDPLDQFPREATLQEKLCLLSVLELALPPISRNCRPIDLIELAQVASIFEVA